MGEFDHFLQALHAHSIGFERLARSIQHQPQSFPPYNVTRYDDDHSAIDIALAGYGPDDVQVTWAPGQLTIESAPKDPNKVGDAKEAPTVYRGIAKRDFKLTFQLGQHVEVAGVDFVNGLLHTDLFRNVPEQAKPRVIPIGVGSTQQAALPTTTTTPKKKLTRSAE